MLVNHRRVQVGMSHDIPYQCWIFGLFRGIPSKSVSRVTQNKLVAKASLVWVGYYGVL